MKCFVEEAIRFWGYSAAICIIDNTNLAIWYGSGSRAVFVPEMVKFAKDQKPYLFKVNNTGADTISLARMGAKVTGVDLVPEYIHYARKLAAEFGCDDVRFIESNVLEAMDKHDEEYDIVYTTEGVECR